MKYTNLVYLFNDHNQVRLGAKKKSDSWFTVSLGKWNGYGGKLEPEKGDTTILSSAVRELAEEAGVELHPEDLTLQGIMHFSFATRKDRDQECHIFVYQNFRGEAQETEEMKPQLRDIDALPYDKMRDTDKAWLPRLLLGEFVEYRISLSDEGQMLDFEKIQ